MIKLLIDRKVTNVMKKEIKKIKLTDNISYYISDNTIYLFQDEYNFSKDDIKIIGKKVALLILLRRELKIRKVYIMIWVLLYPTMMLIN